MIERETISIRPLKDEDKFHIAKWLSDPEILQYYEGRDNAFSLEKVEQKFYRETDNAVRCLVEAEGTPIGYIQFYQIEDEERKIYGYTNQSEIIYGMDQFIGESTYWNKGIGTQLVQALVNYLIKEKAADRIVMDPQTWNERAIRCYEKCGFKKVKLLPKHEWHEGEIRDCWLIEYSPNLSKGDDNDDNYVC